MYFSDYKLHRNATLNPRLLWDFNPSEIDFQKMRNVVVQRVIERGWPNDWYFMLNQYGLEEVKAAVKELPYLNEKDMHFVSHQFGIPLTSMKCFERKQSVNQRWNS